ncbi:MAG: DNA translocase FtsK 4TM domain-containing protein [Puniceicoccales bacterium]|nr:DNA translocase FtsK 4TM domain-containing protein [Puniceicoccales bacterium]
MKRRIVLGMMMGIVALSMFIALIDFHPQQSYYITTHVSPESHSFVGNIATVFAFWFFRYLGMSAYLLPCIPGALSFYFCFPQRFYLGYIFSLTFMLLLWATLGGWIQYFYAVQFFPSMTAGLGGIVGDLTLQRISLPLLGKLGTILALLILLCTQLFFHIYWLLRKHPLLHKLCSQGWRMIKLVLKMGRKLFKVTVGKIIGIFKGTQKRSTAKKENLPEEVVPIAPKSLLPISTTAKSSTTTTDLHSDLPPLKMSKVQIFEAAAINPTDTPLKQRHSDYIFPTIDLLEPAKVSENPQENCEAMLKRLIEILAQFGVSVFPGEIHKGPVITRYEVTPEVGVRVERIANLDKNIAMGLAAKSVRVIAPVPGKSCVGIEIPNKNPEGVHLREILESKNWTETEAAIPLVLGRGVTGEPMIYDLAKMPHLLIAGTTGAGKTVCINAIIASLLYHASPEDLRFLIVDPKIVEMQNYNKLPHMLIPVVTDPKQVPNALKWLITEMESRYKVFAKAGVRNIVNYNEKRRGQLKMSSKHHEEYPNFPYIVCIIDELADLMMIAPNDIEAYIVRLAQLARAAGIHFILATQRPSVNVITGIIKANLPSRIAFKVSSKIDSRTILDSGGAEALLGQGDMLFLPPGAPGLLRAQGAWVSDNEINRVVNFLHKKNGGPKIEASIQKQIEGNGASNENDDGSWNDELIPRALEVIRTGDHASVSSLQRKLKISYNRAAKIVDTLRERGLIETEIETEL